MLAIQLGPLALPLAPALLLVSLLLAHGAAKWQGGRADAAHGLAAGDSVFTAALLGLLAARASYLAWHARAYLDLPWAALDLRDGGWQPEVGWAVAACWLLWRGMRRPTLRRALGSAALTGAGFWMLGSALTGTPAGARLPDLPLLSLANGQPITLAQAARGRPVVLNLWASWCGPCRQEMPMLDAAQRRQPELAFLFVNQGESAEAVQAYLRAQGLGLREVMLDPASGLGPALGSRGLPTTLFYGTDGRLVDAHMGVLNAAALASRLGPLSR